MNFVENFLLCFVFFNLFYCKELYLHQQYASSYHFFQLKITFDKYNTLLLMNTFNNYTWLPDSVQKDFNNLNVTLIDKISFKYTKNQTIPATLYSSPLKMINDDIVIYDYYMYIKQLQIWEVCNSGIGFGYKFDNYNYSLIHKLYESKYITEKQFSFVQETAETKGEIVLGSISHYYDINTFMFKGKCNVIKSNSYWSCGINSIKYENETFDNNGDVIEVGFHSVMKYSIHSKQVLTMIHKVMKDKCMEVVYNMDENKLLCDKKSVLNSTYNIIIDFGSQMIEIPLHMLFQCDNEGRETCLSTFLYIENDSSLTHILNPNTQIIFGPLFFKIFKIITFNYDDNSIAFYSNTIKIFSSNNKDNNNKQLELIYIELALLFPFIIINLILKYYINNPLKYNTY